MATKKESFLNQYLRRSVSSKCLLLFSYSSLETCETDGSKDLTLISPEQKALPLGLLLSQHAYDLHFSFSESELAHQF